ncbi:MAG: chemotaxis protein CheW [Candidatus Omnitrophica bacterium]|nr:chemotaxis protein CheW [Candidatus Omnitrophota bacterium]
MTDKNKKIFIEADDDDMFYEEVEQAGDKVRMVSFACAGENYWVEITDIKELIIPGQITKVPNTPDFIAGVTNLRGEVISLIDFKKLSGTFSGDRTSHGGLCLITDITGENVGILIEKMEGTIEVNKEIIQPPLNSLKKSDGFYIKGQAQVDGKIHLILDIEKILNSREINELRR